MLRHIACVVLLGVVQPAMACRSAPAYLPEAVAELARAAPYVVEATLVSRTSETSGRFKIHAWLKGSGPTEIDISGFGHGTDCRSPMYTERSLVFLSLSGNGTYELLEARTYAGMRPATKENIEAVVHSDRPLQ